MGLRDAVEAAEDVQSETIHVEAWGTDVEFRGMSYASMVAMQSASLVKAAEGDLNSALDILAATMCDPETHELAFADEEGRAILARRSQASIMECVQAALRVLGVDEADTAGKDSSGTPTPDERTSVV